MERARRLSPVGPVPQDLDNVLRLRLARSAQQAAAPEPVRGARRRAAVDWSAALDAVEEAADAMNSTEHHAKEIEQRGVALAERALAELKNAEARVRTAEDAARAAEARAAQAEERLREAEDWLERIQDAIETRLLTRAGDRHDTFAA